jgi:hypothetical protein
VHRSLVDQAKQGDEEAFDTLARTVGDRCMAIACRILRDAVVLSYAGTPQADLDTAQNVIETMDIHP